MVVKDIRIVFMGTPEFAVASLEALLRDHYDVCAVVTAPDRPAGRGQKLRPPAVKQYACKKNIPVLQPENLKDKEFIARLRKLQATLFIVVAFRMLPETVWGMPPLGTFNLHASLLPQYRGAAPINRTIMNGEQRGGLTTFFLRHAIDTGNIIFREETSIAPDETAGEYHDRLMHLGAALVIRTVEAIRAGEAPGRDQSEFLRPGEILKTAPKISKEDCRIDWSNDSTTIYNQIRGLSPSPAAFAELTLPSGNSLYLKIFRSEIHSCSPTHPPGAIITDHKNFFMISCRDACISLLEVQQPGKKKMKIHDFLLGLKNSMLS
ncbi:MAG: methionyl-tRNA formyltransferase [Bacteroidales bacterium]|nr:methionyl-tRNA formyltransferase [Bacteroidales bacterium]